MNTSDSKPTPAVTPAAAATPAPVATPAPATPAKPKLPVIPQKGWRNFNGQDNSKFKPKHFQAPRFIQARRAPGK